MSKSAITRREFSMAILTSALTLNTPSGAQEPPAQPTDTVPLSLINVWLPSPMPSEQAEKVAEAVRAMQKTLERLRAHPLPEGSEPAFAFYPLPREGKR